MQPLSKPDLYALLQRAEASVLPSLADNLPNTVIESLTLGIPVIGTRGASIDELIEPGVTGELVSPGNVEELASAIVRIWRGQSAARKGFAWRGELAKEMQPEKAVENFLKLTGHYAVTCVDAKQSNYRERAHGLSLTGLHGRNKT
jgi:glycosyltransferase involved in cell wall biosynthesis